MKYFFKLKNNFLFINFLYSLKKVKKYLTSFLYFITPGKCNVFARDEPDLGSQWNSKKNRFSKEQVLKNYPYIP